MSTMLCVLGGGGWRCHLSLLYNNTNHTGLLPYDSLFSTLLRSYHIVNTVPDPWDIALGKLTVFKAFLLIAGKREKKEHQCKANRLRDSMCPEEMSVVYMVP